MANNVNLLPYGLKQGYTFRRQLIAAVDRYARLFIVFLELLAVFSLILNGQAFFSLKLSERKAAAALRTWAAAKEEGESIRRFQKKAEFFGKINLEQRFYSGALKSLTELIPEAVVINQLQISQEEIKVSAQTDSILSFAALIGKLFSSPSFQEVVLTESEYAAKEKLYKISLELPLIAETLFH